MWFDVKWLWTWTFFFSSIVQTFLNCMTNVRCLLYGACFFCIYFIFTIKTQRPILSMKRRGNKKSSNFFSPSKSQFHSYAKKIDFKSTINYLFCERALFLFAYTLLKKMFNPKLLNFRIKKMKRVVAEHVGRDKKKRGKKTRRKGQPLKSAFWLSIINILKRSENKEPTRTWMSFV